MFPVLCEITWSIGIGNVFNQGKKHEHNESEHSLPKEQRILKYSVMVQLGQKSNALVNILLHKNSHHNALK